MFKNNIHKEKGAVVILLVVLVTGVVLTIGIGLSNLFVRNLQSLRGLDRSLVALSAAETGIERVLRVDYCLVTFDDPDGDEDDRVACLEDVIGGPINPPSQCNGIGSVPNPGHCKQGSPGGGYDEIECRQCAVMSFQNTSLTLPTSGETSTYLAEIVTSMCSASTFCAESTGVFQGVNRKIEVER